MMSSCRRLAMLIPTPKYRLWRITSSHISAASRATLRPMMWLNDATCDEFSRAIDWHYCPRFFTRARRPLLHHADGGLRRNRDQGGGPGRGYRPYLGAAVFRLRRRVLRRPEQRQAKPRDRPEDRAGP